MATTTADGAPTGRSGISAEMQALSTWMAGAAQRALPQEVAEHARLHLLDSLAAMVSGAALGPGQAALRHAEAAAGAGTCTIAGTALTAAPVDAALANGVMAHADETDDSHNASRSHPGCAVIPAALATAEALAMDGKRLLRALTLGYDIGTRVLMAMGGAAFSYRTSLSTHSIAGTFCAAAAAACVAGLDPQRMRWVLDYAGQQSSGIIAWRRDSDHIEKAFVFGGMPARNGVTAAMLVRAGWNGVDDIFSGPDNFFQAYAPHAEPLALVDALGERWAIVQSDIKKWCVGSPIQGPLDGVEAIFARRRPLPDQILRVAVHLAPSVARVVDGRDMPDVCLQHMVAVMLLDGTVTFRAAHDKARMRNDAVLEMRAKVELVPDKTLDAHLPVRVAIVEIGLADGQCLRERVDAVRGTPRNPMTRREVSEKARDLLSPVLGRDKAGCLIETVLAIEDVDDVRRLQPLLQPG